MGAIVKVKKYGAPERLPPQYEDVKENTCK
jgi:hypothetical protein